jgi:sugar O-acyltransferase (sialic acid O-acetyltransferase NeuD family)
VLAEFLPACGYEIVAVADNDPNVEAPFRGVPLCRGRAEFERWKDSSRHGELFFIVAIGGDRGEDRLAIHDYLAGNGLSPASAIHPSAFVARTASIGAGSHILAHAVAGVDVALGIACIVNTAASVDHGCTLDDGVHVGPGATICGEVTIGRAAFLGAGAVVLPRIRIGDLEVVGAGHVVIKDVAGGQVVAGNPAKAQRRRRGALDR